MFYVFYNYAKYFLKKIMYQKNYMPNPIPNIIYGVYHSVLLSPPEGTIWTNCPHAHPIPIIVPSKIVPSRKHVQTYSNLSRNPNRSFANFHLIPTVSFILECLESKNFACGA